MNKITEWEENMYIKKDIYIKTVKQWNTNDYIDFI